MSDHPRLAALIAQLTLDEKLGLVHAADTFRNAGVARLGIPPLLMSDGPNGVRQEVLPGTFQPVPGADDATTNLPCGLTIAATWDPALAEAAGGVLGAETRARGKDVILAPGVNLLRTPLCGRNFEYLGEDPLLAGAIASGLIRGVQAHGVAACVKHFACNNQELNRSGTDAQVSERALRELYLPAFRAAVRAGVLTVMGAYNRVNGEWATHHSVLTRAILKQEWAFAGLVMSDWNSTHADAEALRNGLDLEMGTNLGRWNEYHFADRLRAAITEGRASMADLDDAVLRILRVMDALGCFAPAGRPTGSRGTAAHRAAVRAVAVAGIVVLRGGDRPPLDPARLRSLAVIGGNADRPHAGGGGSSGVKSFDEITPLRGLRERLPGAAITHVRGWPDLPAGVEPIPVRHLAAVDSAGIGGWRMEVWDNARYQGAPIATATVPQPLLARDARPAPGLGELGWSVRWSAELIVPADGSYTLYVTGMDNFQVVVDGAYVINIWGVDTPQSEQASLDLRAGQRVRLAVQLNPKAPHASLSCAWLPPGAEARGSGAADALAAARAADAVVIVGGLDHRIDTEGVDRAGYGLPDGQDALIAAILAERPDAIVVLAGGGPSALPWVDQARTLLWAGYGGECAGAALAAVLCGDAIPRGRLPFTWWRSLADCPTHRLGQHVAGVCQYGEDLAVGYRGADMLGVEPLFPFGHGLGWSAVDYRDLHVLREGGSLRLTATIGNPGRHAVVETVQAYVEPPASPDARPPRELKGFTAVHVPAGGSAPVALTIPVADLARWRPGQGWVIDAGTYRIRLGASSRDLRLMATIAIA
jgi:beta-glucosidase